MRRNQRRFRTVYERAKIPDGELLRVNRLYMAHHPEKTRSDLEYNVITDEGQRVLNTQLIRIYDGDKLVAFSYFDVGQRVVYSKAGIYDPAYAADSLGIYTMLLEVDLAQRWKYDYYYPGYYSPTFSAFDYKLTLGQMEFRDISAGCWIPHPTQSESGPTDPLEVNRTKLFEALDALKAAGIPAEFREYPSFTGRFRPTREGDNLMLDAPQLLLIGRPLPLEFYFTLTYDNEKQCYRYDVVRTANLYDMRVQAASREGVPRFITPVVVHNRIMESEQLPAVIGKVAERLRVASNS